MKMPIIAIRDSVGDVYQHFSSIQSVGAAVRSFTDEVNRASPDNMLYMHAADYELFLLGEFDVVTGRIEVHADKVSLCRGADVKIKVQ